jgi:hypothetical protein
MNESSVYFQLPLPFLLEMDGFSHSRCSDRIILPPISQEKDPITLHTRLWKNLKGMAG